MKKMGILFNDITILNIPFLFKLFKRYYRINIALLAGIMIFGSSSYFGQNEIYSTTAEFKNVSGTSNSPSTALATLLGENNSGLTATEIVGISQSLDFHQRMALSLYADSSFSELNFNNPLNSRGLSNDEIFGHCKGDKDCTVSILRGLVPMFYTITENNEVRTKYIATARALDALTAGKILEKLKTLIVADRVDMIRHSLSEQRKLSQGLILEKRIELENHNLGAISFQSRSIDLQLDELNSTVKSFNSLLGVMKQKLGHSSATFLQTKNTLNSNLSPEQKNNYRKVSSLKNKINLLQENIGKLELTGEDKAIVGSLRSELSAAKMELANFGDLSKIEANYGQFIEERTNKSVDERFKHNVILSEVESFKADYLKMMNSKKGLIKKKLNLETRLEKLRPSFEYLKLLEGQNAKLRLLESTVVSDLVFDKFDSPVQRFKRSSATKTFLYSLFVALFLIMSFVIIRYYYDPVVFDEEELVLNFGDLPTLGSAPKIS